MPRIMRSGKGRISLRRPRALGESDRSGFWYNLDDLRPQLQWAGNKLIDTGLRVGPDELDVPQPQFRTPILPPDPVPRQNPRPSPNTTPVPVTVGAPLPTSPENLGFTVYTLGLVTAPISGGSAPTPPPTTPPSLDFSKATNSQYIGLVFGALALFFLSIASAIAQTSFPVINGTGALQQMNALPDPLGAWSSRMIPCDGTNPDNCVAITGGAMSTTSVVSQPTSSLLNATVSQLTPANLAATVYQSTGTNLHVVVDSCVGCGGGGSGLTDGATFTPGTTGVVPAAGFFQTTATNNPLTNGQGGAVQLTAQRAMFSNLRNSSGTEIGTASTPVQVSLANTGANATPLAATATINQGGSALSTTNGIYANLLQGNLAVAMGNPIFVAGIPLSSGGLSIQSAIVANNTTSVAVGSSAPHQLYGIDAYSISSATPAWLKVYNAAQGSTTCGSGTPIGRFEIPAAGGTAGSGAIFHDANGAAFSTAISYCVTTGIADTDTSAPAANAYVVNFWYK